MRTQRFLNSKKPRFNDGILKEHNKVVYERIFNAYKNGKNRVWIQHASGAGKSYIAAKVIKTIKFYKTCKR